MEICICRHGCRFFSGLLLARELNRTSEELKLLRQDVFRISVDLAKLQERLDGLI